MSRIYVDSNIFIDVVEDRKNLIGKDIAKPASKMFFRAMSCEFYLIISSWTLKELYKHVNVDEIKMLFAMVKKKIITVKYDDKDVEEAKKRSRDNFDDALHIVLAEKEKADYIVTRNIDHFIQIGTKITIKRPENL